MFQRTIRSILPVSAMLLLFTNACLAAPVIYKISGDITVFTGEGSGIDTAGLEGASFVAELVVDSEVLPVSTFSAATSERATYPTTTASIRFYNRPSLPPVTLEFSGQVQAINYFVGGTFTDQVNLGPITPESLGQIDEKLIGWGVDQNVVLPLDFFPGSGQPPVPVFSEFDIISQFVNGFVHDVNDDGSLDPLNGDTIYEVSNGRITASLGASCDIEILRSANTDGDTVTARVFRLANPGTEGIAVELKSWLEVPSFDPVSLINEGADNSLVLPVGLDVDIGPVPLFTVTPATPRGRYEWNCRLIDPVTGEIKSTDVNFFDVQ